MKDGAVITGTPAEVWDQLYAEYGFYADMHWESDEPFTGEVWALGEHPVSFFFAGVRADYTVTVIDDPVASFTVDDITRYENNRFESMWYNDETGERSGPHNILPLGPDSITVTIPSDILSGEHYRIRLATTNYPMISLDNGVDIIISSGAAVTEQQEPMLQVAPNPACHFLHITSDQEISGIDFFNLTGERVLSRQLISKDSVISLSGFASGIYLIHCQLPHHELYRKVVIQ